ncbi:MAG TPA: C39 family peptidase [Allocoleopsis sp.]
MMQAKILRTTIAKQSIAQAKELAPPFKTELKPGTYDILQWDYTAAGHQKVTFAQPIANYQTWIIWGDDIECEGEEKQIRLRVPYYSQRDNLEDPSRTCSTSSHAMVLNFLKPGSVASDDEYFRKFVKPYGPKASTNWDVHTTALQQFGIKSVYRQNLDFADLERSLELGYPVAIGVLHKGTLATPEGGHVLVIVGMDKARGIFYANDPWGEGFKYTNLNGEGVEYPINPSLDRRWMPDGHGSGWGRLITAIDGKPTGLV